MKTLTSMLLRYFSLDHSDGPTHRMTLPTLQTTRQVVVVEKSILNTTKKVPTHPNDNILINFFTIITITVLRHKSLPILLTHSFTHSYRLPGLFFPVCKLPLILTCMSQDCRRRLEQSEKQPGSNGENMRNLQKKGAARHVLTPSILAVRQLLHCRAAPHLSVINFPWECLIWMRMRIIQSNHCFRVKLSLKQQHDLIRHLL